MIVPKYIYICSAGHSGSTLLDLLLGSHSSIASLGEISQLSKNIALNTLCSCGRPIQSCSLWSEVVRRVGAEIGVDILSHPYDLRMGFPRASTVIDRSHQTTLYLAHRELILGLLYVQLSTGAEFLKHATRSTVLAIDNNVRVFEAVRDITGASAIVDSSKSYLKAISLYRRHPDRVRILLLTRDGRAVLSSNLKRGQSRTTAIKIWKHQYTRALPLLRRHVSAEHVLQVSYESLTADPRSTLRNICDFVGFAFEEGMLNFRSKPHHVANGNRMRMSDSSEIVGDNSWQSRLTTDDLRYFERKAGSFNRILGYT